ncbi:Penicillin-binding protein PbpB [Corynebacterium occultum]|uniref:Penicillin-binding protein PbpB n=1 Tax=Corynebacterium occultum TaxID=2675219 RepID=A0A6B8VQF2_9CORY|nr:penicillin-binding protein 2 [Corynebacterium occultum]QGU07812.1 Penicillin-binding protein PbpB [Corynebacterium occultum]
MSQRLRLATLVVVLIVCALVVRLAWVQIVWGPELSVLAEQQRTRVYNDPARRGEITDHEGNQLAFTMQARSLTVSPILLRSELRQQQKLAMDVEGTSTGLSSEALDAELDEKVEGVMERMSTEIPRMIKDSGAESSKVDEKEILEKLHADTHYEVLVRNVDPDVAADIAREFHGVAADHQDIRQYPNGAIAQNIIGKVSMDGQGQFGFEASGDPLLSGVNGRSTEDVSATGQVIPGSLRDQVPAMDGNDVTLTLDLDLQTYVQQQLEQTKAEVLAQSASAVVLDVATGEVLAMANTDTIDPNGNLEKQLEEGKEFGNPSISHPFEPGSVAKIITAAAALEEGLTTPDEVLQVPGSIHMAGVDVKDAWDHGVVPYTTTGVFGKSSNVGTLMLADRLGEEKFAEYLEKFGMGQSTGIELPNESAGLLPSLEQWSGGTFANLPIGQGLSVTTLQMASIYQALANGGERIEPRIIDQVTTPEGEVLEQNEPERVQVVSPEIAKTTVDMFRSVVQSDPAGVQSGTGQEAAVEGYQIAGKTGTAQQVDPETGAYSMSDYWITFAGIAPADDPRFVVAIMMDDPERTGTAAPLFHNIASWLLDRDNIPTSSPMEGQLILQAGQ